MRRPVPPAEDIRHARRRPDVEPAAILLAAATIIAVLVLLVAALLPRESDPAPARPPVATVTD